MLERIPRDPEEKQLRRQIRLSAKQAGFQVAELKILKTAPIAAGVPLYWWGTPRFITYRASCAANSPYRCCSSRFKFRGLENWLKQLLATMKRMLRVDEIKAESGGFRILARAFYFGPEVYPAHKPEMKTFLRYLRDRGLEGDLKTLREMATDAKWDEAKTAWEALGEKLESGATRTLTLYSRANLLESRWAFLRPLQSN